MECRRETEKLVPLLEKELDAVTNSTLRLAEMSKNALKRSVLALRDHDEAAARRVLVDEREINALTDKINDDCLNFIARFQPMGRDLRCVTSMMLMVRDMERIGDYGKNIAGVALQLLDQEPLKPLIDIPAMADTVGQMLDQCCEALSSNCAALAQEVFSFDDRVDDLEKQILRELLFLMIEKPERIERAWRLLDIARILERAGDHATNIAEYVYFICCGKHIKASENRRLHSDPLA